MGTYLSEFTGAQIDTYLNHAKDLSPSHNDTYHTGSSKRATASGVAGVNGSNVILSSHMPTCTQEIYLNGSQLQVTGFRDPDIWGILADAPASCSYVSRTLTLKSGTAQITAARAVMPYPHAITHHLLEATFGYAGYVNGDGGTRNSFLGFSQSLATFPTAQCAGFSRDNTNNVSYIVYGNTTTQRVALSTLPLARNLQATDFITVRLETSESGSAINTAKFYVNGALQFETTSIPTTSVYVGCCAYNSDADVTTESELAINYFSFKRMI